MPASALAGLATEPYGLTDLIEKALGTPGTRLGRFQPVKGAPRSGRIFFRREVLGITQGVVLPHPFSAHEIAFELTRPDNLKFMRFDPPEPPDAESRKGWEVRVAEVMGEKLLIVWAAWVKPAKF